MSAEFDQSSPFQQLYTKVKQIHKNVQKLLDNIKKNLLIENLLQLI
jgi:hypothetical protein